MYDASGTFISVNAIGDEVMYDASGTFNSVKMLLVLK